MPTEADASHEEALEARDEMETQETNEVVEPTPEPEKVEKSNDRQPTAEEFKAMDGAKKHFESENKKLKDELAKSKAASQPATGDPMEAVRLGKALAEISEEEAEIVTTFAKGKFNTLTPTPEQIIQTSKDEVVMGAITQIREKVVGENQTPAPSSPTSIVGGKTAEDLEKMEGKDFAKFVRGEFTKGGGSGV